MIKTIFIFMMTAYFEILGCYSVLQYVKTSKQGEPANIFLVIAIISLGLFSWLLTLHPMESGRTYIIYGGIYIVSSFLWLWFVNDAKITIADISGIVFILLGTTLLMR